MDLKLTKLRLARVETKAYLVFEFKVDKEECFASVSLDSLENFYSRIVDNQKMFFWEFNKNIHALRVDADYISSQEFCHTGKNLYSMPYNHQIIGDLVERISETNC